MRKIARPASRRIAAVGLAGLENQPIGQLSVGQFQRVLFARLMVQEAAVILLDEPFNAIDQKTTADLMQVVRHWQDEGRTVIAALHDLEQVKREFPDALLMARELVACGPARQTLSDENLARARALAAGWSDPAPRSARADAMLYDALIQPFIEFGFMRRALVACLALSIGAGPIGVFLVLRRMSLMGDAMSHAILPGAAIGFLVFGLSMSGDEPRRPRRRPGGRARCRRHEPRDAAQGGCELAGFFLISLALGVLLVSLQGSSKSICCTSCSAPLLAVTNGALLLIARPRRSP